MTNGCRGDVQATIRKSCGAVTGSGVQNTALTWPTSAVLAPMPRPMVAMAMAENPGVRAHRRTARRTSSTSRSSHCHPHASRTSSRTIAGLPKTCRADSFGLFVRQTRALLLFGFEIQMVLNLAIELGLAIAAAPRQLHLYRSFGWFRLHDAGDRLDQHLPARRLRCELPPTGRRKPVVS